MAARHEKLATAVAAGAVGFGLGALMAAAMSSGTDPRNTFVMRLRDRLATRGVGLVAAELGRHNGEPTWVLTLQLPNQHVVGVHAPVERGLDPFAIEESDAIAVRVFQRLL
jgi:hypothetical protein